MVVGKALGTADVVAVVDTQRRCGFRSIHGQVIPEGVDVKFAPLPNLNFRVNFN